MIDIYFSNKRCRIINNLPWFVALAWLIRLWEIIDPKGLLLIKTNAQWDIEALKAVLGSK